MYLKKIEGLRNALIELTKGFTMERHLDASNSTNRKDAPYNRATDEVRRLAGQQKKEGLGALVDYSTEIRDPSFRRMVEKGKELLVKVTEVNYPDTTTHFQQRYDTEYSHPDADGYVIATSRLRVPDDLPPELKEKPRILYQNKIYPGGSLIVQRDYRTHDDSDWNTKIPKTYKVEHQAIAKPLHNSEILWNQYHAVAGERPLTSMTISLVTNDQTCETLAHVVKRKESKTFQKGSDAYYAFLGTPNGQSVVYLLAAHQPDREITHITVKSSPSLSFHIDLSIGDKQK